MRADELVRALTVSQRAQLAKVFKITSNDVPEIVRAMRAEGVVDVLKSALRLRSVREDVAALCANPFDPVYPEDVQDIDALCAIGLLGLADDGGWAVNLDLALALVPSTSLEFGFALTLLARLTSSDFQATARALGVSPQMNRTEYLLAVADAMTSVNSVQRTVMQLNDEQRSVLVTAIEAGELPDDISQWSLDFAAPKVTLHSSEAGRRGLILQFEQAGFGVTPRPVLPLESAERVEDALATIPAPPPMKTKAERRRAPVATKPTPKPGRQRERLLDFSTPAALSPASSPSSFADREALPERRVQVLDASAVIDLRDDSLVRRLRSTPELLADVAKIIERTRVVLRPGVDAKRWSARVALLLSDDLKPR